MNDIDLYLEVMGIHYNTTLDELNQKYLAAKKITNVYARNKSFERLAAYIEYDPSAGALQEQLRFDLIGIDQRELRQEKDKRMRKWREVGQDILESIKFAQTICLATDFFTVFEGKIDGSYFLSPNIFVQRKRKTQNEIISEIVEAQMMGDYERVNKLNDETMYEDNELISVCLSVDCETLLIFHFQPPVQRDSNIVLKVTKASFSNFRNQFTITFIDWATAWNNYYEKRVKEKVILSMNTMEYLTMLIHDGDKYYLDKDFDSAAKNYVEALQLIDMDLPKLPKGRLDYEETQTCIRIGNSFFKLAKYREAEDVYLRALQVVESNDDDQRVLDSLVDILSSLGLIYINQQRYGEAMSYLKRCMGLEIEDIEFRNFIQDLLNVAKAKCFSRNSSK